MKQTCKEIMIEEKAKTDSVLDYLKMTSGNVWLYQIFSRKNDVNGNPYRLILIYNLTGKIFKACEARCSRPNIVNTLYESDQYQELPNVFLTPAEYNRLKRKANRTGHCSAEQVG